MMRKKLPFLLFLISITTTVIITDIRYQRHAQFMDSLKIQIDSVKKIVDIIDSLQRIDRHNELTTSTIPFDTSGWTIQSWSKSNQHSEDAYCYATCMFDSAWYRSPHFQNDEKYFLGLCPSGLEQYHKQIDSLEALHSKIHILDNLPFVQVNQ